MTTTVTILGNRADPARAAPATSARPARTLPWFWVPLSIFAASRLVDTVLLLLTARHEYAPSVLPREPGLPKPMSGRSYVDAIANWDGQWYRLIAEHGYPSHLPVLDGTVERNVWAFYPAYPATVRLVMAAGGLSFGVAATLVSLVCGGLAMCLLHRMLSPRCGGFAASLSVIALCTYPAAVTLQAAYTESMALLLVLAALWCLGERRYGALLAVALLLALTRPIALPLALVAGVHWVARWRRRRDEPFPPREAGWLAVVVTGIGLSFLLWPAVTAVATGSPDAYVATQRAWTLPGQGWPSWLEVLLLRPRPVLVVVVLVAGLALGAVVVRRPARLWGPELRAWAVAYPLYVLGSTLPATSVFRYGMLAVVPWWPFPEVGGTVTSTRERVLLAGLVGALGVVFQYFYLRWAFMIGPDMLGHS